MNKADLVDEICARIDVSRRLAALVVDTLVDSITASVANGHRVTISGFGVFEKRLRAPRVARNPRTGDSVRVPATSVPSFRPSRGFKEAVAGRRRRTR